MDYDFMLSFIIGFTACFLVGVIVLVVTLQRIRSRFWASNTWQHRVKMAFVADSGIAGRFCEGQLVISVLHGSGHVVIIDGEKVWCRFGKGDPVLFYQDGSMPGDSAKVLYHE